MRANAKTDTPHEYATLINVRGSLELEAALELRETLLRAVADAHVVIVKLSMVTAIDYSGVACLLEAYQKATRMNKKFAVTDASQIVSRYLESANLNDLLTLAPDAPAAHAPHISCEYDFRETSHQRMLR